MKIVVFDLDETLGYFVEFGIFWDSLSLYLSNQKLSDLTQIEFNEILDLFPEFLRPNIMNILDYLKKKKMSQCCQKLMIYTNNQGPQKWANYILSYFETKLHCVLFDKVIAAFKINGEHIEICRTTNNKTYDDFIRCTLLPKNAEICYLDDSYYPEMVNENVYYINIKPYTYNLPFAEMYKRFMGSNVGKTLITKESRDYFIDFMEKNIKLYDFQVVKKNTDDYKIDSILSKRILHHLQIFFIKTNNKDARHSKDAKNKTNKRRKNLKTKTKRNKL